ncbi:hypothetical protein Thermo_00943 [Thermoplasmatales archaeon]|nr:hypothetical protein Thermo_00943 [Thermoplasmatales archaeon]
MRLGRVAYILIVAGMFLFILGVGINPYLHDMNSSGTITTARFSQLTYYENGLYVTIIPSNMTEQMTSMDVAVNPNSSGPGNVSLLVLVKDLPTLNYSNAQNFGIKPSNNDSANIWFDNVPPGSYAFVESQNNSMAMIVDPQIPLDTAGVLTFVGAALIFSGFVIFIVSFATRGRRR